MIRYAGSLRAFAVSLSALAGFVDAIGFMALGGFFVSFMSGNSTRLSVGLSANPRDAMIAGGLIISFVIGVFLGSVVGRFASRRRSMTVLSLVSGLLACGWGSAALGSVPVALALVAMAMGAENTIFEREGEVSVGVTYMTGTLVKLGQRAAGAFFGEARLGWLPYLLLWLGLVVGAFVGAISYARLGLGALGVSAFLSFVLALISARLNLAAR